MPYLDRDGVKLYYEETGAGEPTLLLVHGWCCDHRYLAAQAEYFSPRFRVLSVDLRGHGLSDAPQQEYSMEGFADDLAWICNELNTGPCVVVGHSMGGLVTLVMAARHPSSVRAAVLIDSPVMLTPEDVAARGSLVEALHGPDYRQAAAGYVRTALLIPTDDAERSSWIVEGMSAMPQHVMASAMRHIVACDSAAAAAVTKQPLLYIGAYRANGSEALRRVASQLMVGQTVGAGHFNMMEVPEQLNAMIDRFLELSLPK
jgi:pimeloyl-ACP methyl ester carboxylesterase